MEYRRELDGLRAVAVLPVIAFHAGFKSFSGGFVGVDIFFVISGYLITSIIAAERTAGTFTFSGFYERRIRRLLPALSVVTLVCLVFAWLWLLPPEMRFFSANLVAVFVFCANILFYLTVGYFGPALETTPLIHTWSLSVEEQFYILFPILLLVLWRLRRAMLCALLAVLAVSSLVAAQHYSAVEPGLAFFLLPTRAWEILLGAIIALACHRALPARQSRLAQVLGIAGLLLIGYAVYAFDESTASASLYTLIPTSGAALVILFATPETLAGRLLTSRVLVGIGLVSYSAYLWHQPLLAFVRLAMLEEPSTWLLLAVSTASIALAYVTWRFVEQPFRRKHVVGRARVFLILGVTSAALMAVGFAGVINKGFPGRFADNPNQQAVADLQEERFVAIREEVCHFNNRKNTGVTRFIAQWNCKVDTGSPELKRIPVIVTGDSHSADKVLALKANGLAPLQIGGAGCSLVPRFMTPDCRKIFDKLYDEVSKDDFYQYLVLSNSFTENELTLESLEQMLQYWRRFDKKLVWFTAMPEFRRLSTHMQRNRAPTANFDIAKVSQRAEVVKFLEDGGVHVVDTASLFCAINDCKYVRRDGCMLLTDDTHLSVLAAKAFGEHLLRSEPLFKQWAPAVAEAAPDVEGSHSGPLSPEGQCRKPVTEPAG